jgi:hypothetical protein
MAGVPNAIFFASNSLFSRLTMRFVIITLFVIAFAAAGIPAQTPPKSFTRDGVSFSYPSEWLLQDKAGSNADDFEFMNANLDVQLKVTVSKAIDPTPENVAKAKKVLVDHYTDHTIKSFEAAGGKPQSSPATSEIGGVASTGVLVTASLGGSPGNIQIQSALVGDRIVVLTLLGPTSDTKRAAAAWDMLRTTMKVEAQKTPEPTPPKKP